VHPALPAIAFTALSGAGLGVLAVVALADLGAAYLGWPPIASPLLLAQVAGTGLALVVAGLVPSMLRFADPRNLGRPAAPWLSRQAMLALLPVPVACAFIAALALDVAPRRMWGWAAATLLFAWTVLACAARVDASRDPVGEGGAARASLAALVFGHASGAVIVEAIVRPASGATWVASVGVALLLASWLVGEEHAHPGARPSRARALAIVASVVVPGVWLVAGLGDPAAGTVVAVSCVAGRLVERWFVADAEPPARIRRGDRTAVGSTRSGS
jgi:DMSO reductase anchor subunit